MLAGQQFAVGPGVATVTPDFDFETISFAGYLWVNGRWESLPGFSAGEKARLLLKSGWHPSLSCEHETFHPQLLAYDLKDGTGAGISGSGARPISNWNPCLPTSARARANQAHNVAFEWSVWQCYCVLHPRAGYYCIEQLR